MKPRTQPRTGSLEIVAEHVLDAGTRLWLYADGSLYIATGDDYYDVWLSPDGARALVAFLAQHVKP